MTGLCCVAVLTSTLVLPFLVATLVVAARLAEKVPDRHPDRRGPAKYQLVSRLKTVKALGLAAPPAVLARTVRLIR